MKDTTRGTAIQALEERLDRLLADVREDPIEYAKWDPRTGQRDWRGEIHRRRQAERIRAVRNALRDLRPRQYPDWYRDPKHAVEAYAVEGR